MPDKASFLRRVPLHPFVMAAFSVLGLYAVNAREVAFHVIWRPLLAAELFVVLFFVISLVLSRNIQLAGLLAAAVGLLFISYGHVYNLLVGGGIFLGRNRYLIPLFFLMLALAFFWLTRPRRNLSSLTVLANWAAIILFVISLLQISSYWIRRLYNQTRLNMDTPKVETFQTSEKQPDVYYIVLDTYSRSDVLLDVMGFDNQGFMDGLIEQGFYIAECSAANYPSTNISLASSLNMQYLQEMAAILPVGVSIDDSMPALLKHSLVRQQFEQAGYRVVAFATGYDWLEWTDADTFLTPQNNRSLIKQLNPFEAMWLQTTAATILNDVQALMLHDLTRQMRNPTSEHVQRQLLLLDTLDQAGRMPGPKFVYAHVMIPHGPLVFRADGSLNPDPPDIDQGKAAAGWEEYLGQVEFINGRVLRLVAKILDESPEPPVIILQSDHGVKGHRFPILNAFFLPTHAGRDLLYPSISPVNTFRVVFNAYFGAAYPLLEDRQYEPLDQSLEEYRPADEQLPYCAPVLY